MHAAWIDRINIKRYVGSWGPLGIVTRIGVGDKSYILVAARIRKEQSISITLLRSKRDWA